jgi:hypothetical protein
VNDVNVNAEELAARLRGRITNRTLYPSEGLTLRNVLTRAADLACEVVDQMAGRAPVAASRIQRKPGQGRPDSSRTRAATEKRQRLQAALAGGPLHYGEIQQRAKLTGGECSYLLKSTPGIVRVGPGRYAIKSN